MHELSLSSAIVNTVVKHADGRPVSLVSLRVGRAAAGRAGHARVLLRLRARRGRVCEGARLEQELVAGAAALRGAASASGRSTCRSSRAPTAAARACRGRERERVRGRVDRGRGGGMHRTKVKIVEEALDANNTIAQANRADFDRAGVRVVNFMSAPGRRQDDAARARGRATCPGVRVGVLEGDVQGSMDADRLAVAARAGHAAQHRPELRRRVPPRREHGALGAARRCRSTRSTCW